MSPYLSLEVYRLNVGQGDAAIITLSQHDPLKRLRFAAMLDFGHKHEWQCNPLAKNLHRKLHFCLGDQPALDALIISHLDQDHFNGLNGLIQRHIWAKLTQAAIRDRKELYSQFQDRSALAPSVRQDLQKLVEVVNKMAEVLGDSTKISTRFTRSRSDAGFEKVKEDIQAMIIKHSPSINFEGDVKIGKDTVLILPQPVTSAQKATLQSLKTGLQKLGCTKVAYGQDLSDQADLVKLLPSLKDYEQVLRFVPNSSGKRSVSKESVGEQVLQQNKNKRSLITLFQVGSLRYLSCGDLPLHQLTRVAKQIGEVQFLQCPHHGGKGHLSVDVLNILRPQAVFLSFGNNAGYRHPHKQTIQCLQSYRVYSHLDPLISNGDLTASSVKDIVVLGRTQQVYQNMRERPPQSLMSDLRLVLKTKKMTAKIVYLKQFGQNVMLCHDKFGKDVDWKKPLPSGWLSDPQRAKSGRFKFSFKTLPKLVQQRSNLQILSEKTPSSLKLELLEGESLLATKQVTKLVDGKDMISYREFYAKALPFIPYQKKPNKSYNYSPKAGKEALKRIVDLVCSDEQTQDVGQKNDGKVEANHQEDQEYEGLKDKPKRKKKSQGQQIEQTTKKTGVRTRAMRKQEQS